MNASIRMQSSPTSTHVQISSAVFNSSSSCYIKNTKIIQQLITTRPSTSILVIKALSSSLLLQIQNFSLSQANEYLDRHLSQISRLLARTKSRMQSRCAHDCFGSTVWHWQGYISLFSGESPLWWQILQIGFKVAALIAIRIRASPDDSLIELIFAVFPFS